jgi:hypothetical protein
MSDIEGTAWTDAELAGAVAAYRKMQQLEKAGEPYVKKRFYEQLERQFGRDAKAFERRLQNISAVLNAEGLPWLAGLAPAPNVGPSVTSKLRKLLAAGGLPPYHAKLPAMRAWLIEVARQGDKATYGALMAAFSLDRFNLRAALGALGHESRRRGEPIITALVVNTKTQRCSEGLFKEFGVEDDEAERWALYSFWRVTTELTRVDLEPSEDDSLEQRASRFARQEVRPQQAAFRKRVFLAYKGVCAISGCAVSKALDAAHLVGRDWRKGHNQASDGILLRRDLHALYDAGLLTVDRQGLVSMAPEAKTHYSAHEGFRVAMATANSIS